jgi:nascent polypeptide-associated complex subunit alpha
LRRVDARQARRMMQQMGMKVSGIPDVQQVIIKTPDREIIIERPSVAVLNMRGQQIFQVVGQPTERAPEAPPPPQKPAVAEEDAQLVAQQANASLEEAKRALEETDGNLAQAILLLQSRAGRT